MKDIIENMKAFIKEQIEENDILRYVNQFPEELDYNIYQYGNLDITYWELLCRLCKIGYFSDDINPRVLRELYPFLDIEAIVDEYKRLVREAVDEIVSEINTKENKR